MIGRTNVGGAGGGLNFTVINGLTAPASPKENMIWIQVETPISQVLFTKAQGRWSGILNSAEILYESDDTYETVGTTSFVVNKGKIGLYNGEIWARLKKCYYNGESVDAFIRKNGEWVRFSDSAVYLYNAFADDVQCTGLTGGWEAKAWKYSPSSTAVAPTVSMVNNMIASVPSGKSGSVIAKNNIDFTPWSYVKLHMVSAHIGSGSWGVIQCIVHKSRTAANAHDDNIMANVTLIDGQGSKTNYTLTDFIGTIDVRSVNGSYPISMSMAVDMNFELDQIWLEE